MNIYKMFIVMLLLVQGFSLAAKAPEKFYEAIEESDLDMVKKLLKRARALEKKEKKQLLDAAEDVVDMRKNNLSLFKSPRDLTKLGLGALLAGIGSTATAVSVAFFIKGHRNPRNVALSGIGGVATIYGLYKAFCGISCQTAYARLTVARKITEELKKAEEVKEQVVVEKA